jgi:fibronectin type 3 domain-containing protein
VKIDGVASQSGVTLAVSGPPAPIPGAPQSLSSSSNTSGQIVLTWTPVDGLAARFHVERQIGGTGAFTEIAVVPVPAITFTDTGVTAGISYQYRVRAENDYGFSAYSAVVTGTIPVAPLTPPSNVNAVPASQTQINLTWNTASTNATKFHIERKSGATGAYAEITVVPSTTTSYQDTTVQPSTTYTYRMRSEGATGGLSSYSSESSATTPALLLPPAPTLQGTATSPSQVHLSWSTTATGILLYSVERRTTTGGYSQISQPTATSTSFDDSGLSGSTTYVYRMRVQTGAGFSPYSNEVTVTTLQALPAAPTNLQATASSSSQVNLTWTNNAPNATAIRVESQPAGSTNFSDVGAAATLSSASISNLQPNTTYTFRVRAQNTPGYSGYSNTASATTLAIPKTVFLIHGLGQSHLNMKNLAVNLSSSYGLAPGRFTVDYGFDFSDCVDVNLAFCSANCTIPGGAQRLAQYIVSANPPGDVVLIGFSLGGLIARDMIVNNRIILNGRKINLVTIGTPNLGYPYLATDSLVFCSAIVSAMEGNWRSQPGSIALSNYLLSLTNQWSAYGFPGSGRTWLAASGRACNIPTRLGTGCRDQNPYSDGVVCQDSAAYSVSTSAGTQPNDSWADPNRAYVHSFSGFTSFILCNTSDQAKYLPLYDPPPTPGGLFSKLTAVLNGM